MAQTFLDVPVPEADPLVRAALARQSTRPAVADDDVIAHITLLGPFLPLDRLVASVLDDLAAFFATVEPFSFLLAEVRSFSAGAVYLAPLPEAPFRSMTAALAARYPETPPYGGQFDRVIPHMTIGFARPETAEGWLRAAAESFGPIAARATEARLAEADETFLATRHRFPLGPAGHGSGQGREAVP
jgi:hypothetical protein